MGVSSHFRTITIIYSLVCGLVLSRPTSKLSSPRYSKWTDAVFRYQWFHGRQTLYIHDLHEKYGPMTPIVRVAPNQVTVAGLEIVKPVYTIKGSCRKTKFYELLVSRPIQVVSSTADVGIYRKLQRLIASQMSESSLKWMVPQCRRLHLM
ncbi:hypothetical protein E4U61_005824 [Claviceps capensis]|nr:hypothetical protein E4U61_005824 [Claviceps capensis]